MKKYGLQKSDYGHIAIAQRAWAAKNPFAVYRTPLTMEEYLAAPMVADPLSRYDCVPVVAGAPGIALGPPPPGPPGPGPAGVRPPPPGFHYDNPERGRLPTRLSNPA